ncbi:MAG: hypothetical protein P8Y68_12645 [Anaerolineales bacterium]
MPHKHHITHIELPVEDANAAAKFYQAVFEWNITEFEEMNYTTFAAEGGTGGGFNPVSEENPFKDPTGNLLALLEPVEEM